MFAKVLKANPYHDKSGAFTTKDKASFVSTGPKFQKDKVKPDIAKAKAKLAKVKDSDHLWFGDKNRSEVELKDLGWGGPTNNTSGGPTYKQLQSAKPQAISTKGLLYSQGNAHRDHVERAIDNLDSAPEAGKKPVEAIRGPDGKISIRDGHHRVSAAILAGRETIDAVLFETIPGSSKVQEVKPKKDKKAKKLDPLGSAQDQC